MERKRGIFRRILILYTLWHTAWTVCGCISEKEGNCIESDKVCQVTLEFALPEYTTKSSIPEEDRIRNMNLLIFREGKAEDLIWISDMEASGESVIRTELIKGYRYTFHAFANFGERIVAGNEEELSRLIYVLDSPEDLMSEGIPMHGSKKNISVTESGSISLGLERLAAKISLKIDRSRLSEGTQIIVRKAVIGNSPSNSSVLEDNKITSIYDRFENGWSIKDEECGSLNTTGKGGISGEVSLYMLENMQGKFPYTITDDMEKVFADGDPMGRLCSYVELELEYLSDRHYSTDRNLIYRFYLGEGLDDINIERNCHYHILVTPKDDGLSGSGWRVDKTGIGTYVREIQLSDEKIRMTYKGEEYLLDAAILPHEATYREVLWESSDSLIAEVDGNGLVTAGNEGSCTIICTAADGSGTKGECEVTVRHDPPHFIMYPGEYIEGRVGEDIHIWCDFFPPNAPFDPGYEELNFDKSRGIYDYRIDEDGKGVVLMLRNPGTGIVLMTAGAPVNQSGMSIIVVRK